MREKKEWKRVEEEEKTTNKQHKEMRELGFGLTSLALEIDDKFCSLLQGTWQPLFFRASSSLFTFPRSHLLSQICPKKSTRRQCHQAPHSKLKQTR
jgi:hypothetical protein